MNIAILGFGTVGTGVYDIIKKGNTAHTQNLTVSHIFVRETRTKDLPEMTANIDDILLNDDVDVVVEVMGGIEPAHDYILKALQNGKHVVSANKAVIAKYMDEFVKTAQDNNVDFYFESSVAGGIPWIKNLERSLRIDNVSSISGIFNGTSNFILDQMKKTGKPFADILKEAQDLGYAEADPSADIDGYDIENKLCISLNLAYNTSIKPSAKLPCFGIRNITDKDINYFNELGLIVKLMGKSRRAQNEFDYVIEPTLYNSSQIESSINDNFNYASLNGDTIGELGFMGQGAGKFPTANAVVQDILDIVDQAPRVIPAEKSTLKLNTNLSMADYLVRTSADLSQYVNSSQIKSVNDTYSLIESMHAGKMHQAMAQLLKEDNQAFMVNIAANDKERVL
ncbi:homoserine dehydrogenase [Holzapfeliella floricola]|nr:homoserine dehydrogenase [Holzapfeliella floricola]